MSQDDMWSGSADQSFPGNRVSHALWGFLGKLKKEDGDLRGLEPPRLQAIVLPLSCLPLDSSLRVSSHQRGTCIPLLTNPEASPGGGGGGGWGRGDTQNFKIILHLYVLNNEYILV